MARSHCANCGATFSGLSGFELHRIGAFEVRGRDGRVTKPNDRRCLTAEEMQARGLVLTDNGIWRGEPKESGFFTRIFHKGAHDDD